MSASTSNTTASNTTGGFYIFKLPDAANTPSTKDIVGLVIYKGDKFIRVPIENGKMTDSNTVFVQNFIHDTGLKPSDDRIHSKDDLSKHLDKWIQGFTTE